MVARLLDVTENAQGWVSLKLNRPKERNALNGALLEELAEALEDFGHRSSTRLLVLEGPVGAFCSGADLAWLRSSHQDEFQRQMGLFHGLILGVVRSAAPVLGLISGPAAGFGADLAWSCDLRVMHEKAFFEESFSKIGLMPDGGGTYWMNELLGPRAFSAIARAKRFYAPEALQLGLVEEIWTTDDWEPKRKDWLTHFCSIAPLSLRESKKAINAHRLPLLQAALKRESEGQERLLQSKDHKEGLTAFFEKRQPQYCGE
ncbi:MAG: enoyl-CoA hydratase-related protein [Polyangiaceae bacterium]|nr:enoyl-CoA hydratase-related protein [Polyangiaceae bacterium]